MKRTLKRLLCGFLATLMCVTMLPVNAFAWSYMSHANSANILYLKTLSNNLKYSERSTDVYTLLNNEIDNTLRYSIPKEFYDAITKYPEAFRAGSLGPDFYPDMLIGQMYIHPYDDKADVGSGDWLYLLIDSVNRLPQYSEGRLEALSFTLGYMLHYCGDLFGHDFVNTFSGGTFPSFSEVDIPSDPEEMDTLDDPELNNILSHMAIESTMDSFINSYAYGGQGLLPIKAPNKFVTDSLVLKGNMPSGVADIYYKFEDIDVGSGEEEESDLLSGIPIYLDVIVTFRKGVMAVADKFRPNTELITMGISSYADQWAQDIDRALYGLTDTFDMIAHRLVTGEKNPNIDEETLHDWIMEGYPLKEILKDMLDLDEVLGSAEGEKQNAVSVIVEELSLWVDTYAWKALGIPDVFVDGLPEWLDYITLIFTWPMDIVLAAVKTAFAAIFAAILVEAFDSEITWALSIVEGTKARLEDAAAQLDHEDNPYKPFANNYNELMQYFNKYSKEQQLLSGETVESLISDTSGKHVLDQLVDSDFEAFYNTMAMFKLILMGPENFTYYFKSQTDGAIQTAYTTNIAELEATVLRLAVKTIDMPRSGTDDNVWAYVYGVDKNGKLSNEPIAKKLLDNSLNNDLECGDTNIFDIDLPKPMKLTEFEIILEQDETATVNGGWGCESINVIPMHAGVPLCSQAIGVGGNLHMNDGVIWNLEFQKALHYHRQSSANAQWPVTHVEVRIQTGTGDYDSGTDQDVKLYASSTEIGSIAVDLDKYLYDDFEDGDDDTYMVPIGYMFSGDRTNTYPTLGNLHLSLKQNSDYDWFVKSVTVTPYYGTIKLSDPWTIKDQWILESEDKIDLTPDKDDLYYYGRTPLELSYVTALDDGLLEGIRSLDAGVQWTEMPVFWDTPEGRNFFFKYFKGFSPDIEFTLEDDIVGATAPVTMTIDLHGKWNGVGEERRNALAEYAQNTLGQDTYSKMSPVTGDVTIEIINAETGEVVKTGNVQNVTGTKKVSLYQYGMYSNWTPGTYNIRVVYDPSNSAMQEYSYAEKTFENAFTVPESMVGKTLRVRENNIYYGDTTGAGIYEVGSTVTVTARAAEGYKFVRWELGDGSSPPFTATTGRVRVTVTDDMTLVAVFEPITCTITAETNSREDAYGTVSGGGTYNYGDGGTLTPIPADGYVFAGWYGDIQCTEQPISTENPLLFTATTDATIYAKFVPAATVRVSIPDGDECGYRVFISDANSDALQGGDQKEDMVGKSFEVENTSPVSFTVDIKDGYVAGNDFKVQVKTTSTASRPIAITLTLKPDENGKYTFQANDAAVKVNTIYVNGVERDQTATPTITCTEDANGRLTIAATGEGVITLYVNGKAVSNPYTFVPDDTAFTVHATAQAEGKAPSDLATLNNSRFVVPIVIEDSDNGTVEVDKKYDAPGTKAMLSILPKEGYVLDKLTITSEDGSEIEYTSQDIVETENEDGSIDIEIVESEDEYYFARPTGKATVKALFRPEGTAGVTISGKVTSFGTGTTTVELLDENGDDTGFTPCTGTETEFTYTFTNVPAGDYIIRVMKANHVTRDYKVSVE